MAFTLKQFEIGPMQNYGYMISDDRTKDAVIVDPAWAPQKLLAMVEAGGFKLKGFLVTHAHFDHTNAIVDLLKRKDVPVYANKAEIDYAKSGNSIVGELGSTAKPVEGGSTLQLGDTTITFLHTPGHTPGSQCLSVGDYLITGDTLFIGGCGRTDLPGGNPELLFNSLKKIAALPAATQICPGHDYGDAPQRKLSDEIENNPYLKMDDVKEFLDAIA